MGDYSTELFKMLCDLGELAVRYADAMSELSNTRIKVVDIPDKAFRYLGKKSFTIPVDVPEGAVLADASDPPDIYRCRVNKALLVVGANIRIIFRTESGDYELRLDKMSGKDILFLTANKKLVEYVVRNSLDVMRSYVEVLESAVELARKLNALAGIVGG